MRTYFIETWGCQMNQHDSERLAGALHGIGLSAAGSAEAADLVLLNTCSVREKPVQKIVSRIGVLATQEAPPTIGVCGCVAQQEGEALLARSPHVGFVLGPGQTERVGDAVRSLQQGRRSVLTGFDEASEYSFDTIFRTSNTRGMVTVIEGCNEYCTFCIVPYTRGREVSRPLTHVVDQVRRLATEGIREVELLGQTINQYRCPESGSDLADLLDEVARVGGLDRVRFITSHPRHFDPSLIAVVARHHNLSRYLHLPVQSGSNGVLKRMNRKYTREDYLDLVDRIRRSVPDINLSTDVIVGFPGESERDFEDTLELLDRIRFGQVYAFAFSPRPKTPAARYDDQLAEEVKKERLHRLFSLTDAISLQLNQACVGGVVRVLIDGESRRSTDDWQGRAEDNRVVNMPKKGLETVGDIVEVQVTRATPHSLVGEIVGASAGRLPVVDRVAS